MMDPSITGVVLQYGLAGVGLIGLALALRYVHGLWVESQNKRITEAQTMTERVLTALNANTEANRANLDIQKSTRDLVEAALSKRSRVR